MPISLGLITGKNNGSSGFHVKPGSGIAPRRRPSTPLRTGSGRRVNEFLIKKFSELCELCITMVESFRSLRKFCPDSKLLNQ